MVIVLSLGVRVCLWVCVLSLHTAKSVYTLLKVSTELNGHGFTLNLEDYQLTDFSETASFKKLRMFLAFTVHPLLAHTCVLTGCTCENSQRTCGTHSKAVVLKQ